MSREDPATPIPQHPMAAISLVPLTSAHHTEALQAVYRAAPGYWQMYNLAGSPQGQADRDLADAEAEPGRTLMGMVLPKAAHNPAAGAELIGLVDLRLHWPEENQAYLGLILVAEAYRRQGYATPNTCWQLLRPWLAENAGMTVVRLGVEQFNPGALKFFEQAGFTLTGEATRSRVGSMMVRRLTMEQWLGYT